MHTVTLNPTAIALQAGGAPVTQTATVENVPEDFTVAQVISVAVGAANVDVTTNVTVDNPAPATSGTAAASAYSLAFGTPVQDSTVPTTWTVQITYTPA